MPCVDIQDQAASDEMREQERMLFARHGPLTKRSVFFSKLTSAQRKFFDSGEWALSKEGKTVPGSFPGGVPPEMLSPKLVPSPKVVLRRSLLDVIYDSSYEPQMRTTTDY